jgi:hypothetical protein
MRAERERERERERESVCVAAGGRISDKALRRAATRARARARLVTGDAGRGQGGPPEECASVRDQGFPASDGRPIGSGPRANRPLLLVPPRPRRSAPPAPPRPHPPALSPSGRLSLGLSDVFTDCGSFRHVTAGALAGNKQTATARPRETRLFIYRAAHSRLGRVSLFGYGRRPRDTSSSSPQHLVGESRAADRPERGFSFDFFLPPSPGT